MTTELKASKNSVYSARYRERNPEKCRELTQAWKDANPQRRAETKAAWQKENAVRHRAHQHNRRALTSGGKLSPTLALALSEKQGGRCACCGSPLGNDYHMDHIIPLARGGANVDENIQLLTARCNLRKGAR